MKTLQFSRDQISAILTEVASSEDGYNQILKYSLEALMRAEREEHNLATNDQSNGYRPRKTYGNGRMMELKVPRSRLGQFYPVVLGLLRNQEEECRRLAFSLYGKGLTTEQVGELFDELYGRSYSKSSISRMFDYARDEVERWQNRPLEAYFPILFIDATFISVRRGESVSKEAFYTVLEVRADRTREVLGVFNIPTESATGWRSVLQTLKKRGLKEVGLVVSDGLSGLEDVLAAMFHTARHQLCVVHLIRLLMKKVRVTEREKLSCELKEIFQTGDRSYTIKAAWALWLAFTERWGKKYPSIKAMQFEGRYKRYFTYLEYDHRIQAMIYTTNWIERLNRDYKRVTKMRGALPDPKAAILLLGNVAMTRSAYERKVPKLNYEEKLFKWTT